MPWNLKKAIEYRDLLNSVNQISPKQKITSTSHMDDRDVIAFARAGDTRPLSKCFLSERKAYRPGSFLPDRSRK